MGRTPSKSHLPEKFVQYAKAPSLGRKNGKIIGVRLNTAQDVTVVVILKLNC
jgi:hypothetical protein